MQRSTATRLALTLIPLLLFGLVVFLPHKAHASTYATYYVSPGGSDSNSGLSPASSWATIAHARDVLRTIPGSDMTGDIVVNLLYGTYTQTSTLTFESQDSGANGYNIIYQAYNYGTAQQAHPVISGGQQITGWTLYDSSKNIWQASVGNLQTRQLYVNGQRAQRTSGAPPVTLTQTDAGYTASANTMASWRNPSNIEFVYTGQPHNFQETLCSVASIASNGTITMKQPCWDNDRLDPGSSSPHTLNPTVENAFELLNSSGEWYLDTSAQKLYYIPRAGEDMSTTTVIAPTVQTLMSVTGTLNNPVTNIQFKGIGFEYATWLGPDSNSGYAEVEAGVMINGNAQTEGQCDTVSPAGTCPFGAWDQTPANVAFTAAQNIRLERDTFTHLGASALSFDNGCQNNVIIGNTFTDISANGIQLGDVDNPNPSDSREISSGNQIVDNYLHDMPVEFRGSVPIFVPYSQNTLIAHNQMDNLPWSGIDFGWGWSVSDSSPNVNQNGQIKDNLIFNHMQLLMDGGGIRTIGQQGTSMSSGVLIQGNVIHDQQNNYNAIYNDGGSDYVTDQDNVLYNNPNDWGGCRDGHVFGNFLFQNNFWHVTTPAWGCGNPDNTTIQNNTAINDASDCAALTACQGIVNNAGIEAAYQDILSGGDSNVALNKTTYSSSNYSSGYTAAMANDGNLSTGWSPTGSDTGPWWEVDLGQAYTIDQIQLVTRQDIDQPVTRQNFEVWASNNADMSISHVVLGSYGTPSLPYQSTWTLTVTDHTPYRYVVLVKTVSEYFFIAELEVYGH